MFRPPEITPAAPVRQTSILPQTINAPIHQQIFPSQVVVQDHPPQIAPPIPQRTSHQVPVVREEKSRREGTFMIKSTVIRPPEAPKEPELTTPIADVSVVLCSWNRPQNLRPQVAALHLGSVRPKRTICWVNAGAATLDEQVLATMEVVRASTNLGAWMRFRLALEADTEIVAVLDDDVIPEARWLEEAVIDASNGYLVSVTGIRYAKSGQPEVIGGPESELDQTTQVDFGMGGWVLRRDLLSEALAARTLAEKNFGWGVHLSVVLGALGVKTIVLPYVNNTAGTRLVATDQTSLHNVENMQEIQQRVISGYRAEGWRFLCEELPALPHPTELAETEGQVDT
jgi:hypothetical protein